MATNSAVSTLVSNMTTKMEIEDRVQGLFYFKLDELRTDLLPDNMTDWVDLDFKKRYSNSIVKGIIAPLLVWSPDGNKTIYLLKGIGFKLLIEELSENYTVPTELPCVQIRCENREDAEAVALRLRSKYRAIDQSVFIEYIEKSNIDWQELKKTVRFPDISEARLESGLDIYDLASIDGSDEDTAEIPSNIIIQRGDLFSLSANGVTHRLICGDVKSDTDLGKLMGNDIARMVFTDSPYNLKTSFFSGKGEAKHEDFLDAGGEMTDDEFVDFIFRQMQVSIKYTMPGAIHYYCMDFRHQWHMCSAAKKAYDTYEPKQLCVWNKSNFGNGSFYRAKHELVFIWRNGDEKHLSHIDMKDRIRSNVWDYPISCSLSNSERDELKNHPTPKPVAMYADAMLDVSNQDDIVVDWFGGSGTCIICLRVYCYQCCRWSSIGLAVVALA